MRAAFAALAVSSLALLPQWSAASVVYTQLATPLTTAPNAGGGCCDGTGVWFNPLTGYAEARGFLFPSTLYEDGKFLLLLDNTFAAPQAQIFTQGFFSRGNGVVYASTSNQNPAWFGVGASIGPTTGYQNPGAGFPDLGPAFGNASPGRGFVGLTLRDPTGASSADIFYGFADITVNADYSLTLNGFAYESQRLTAITTFISAVPEPTSAWTLGLGLFGVAAAAWRRRSV